MCDFERESPENRSIFPQYRQDDASACRLCEILPTDAPGPAGVVPDHGVPGGLHEECGVFGICAPGEDVVTDAYIALFALQHRGQESCGIAVNHDGVISLAKGPGLVGDVLTERVRAGLGTGGMAVGHCRYATTGRRQEGNTQPLLVNHLKGSMALAHNGNLVNARALREEFEQRGSIFHGTSDSEVLAYAITDARLHSGSIEDAVALAMRRVQGAVSGVVMSARKLIGMRDALGFRPLCIGRLGDGWVIASESCALDAIGATFVRDVSPGEIVIASPGGELASIRGGEVPHDRRLPIGGGADEPGASNCDGPASIRGGEVPHDRRLPIGGGADEPGASNCDGPASIRAGAAELPASKPRALCVFELIYFARPDSVIDGTSVQSARNRAGALLAIDHPVAADVVVGVPDSGIDAALGFARQSGIAYGIGFIKNKYIGRTFIEPGQNRRERAVRIKLNPVAETVRGKRVVLVDDSIVRGTTISRIVGLLRDAGAAEVHVRLSAPPFLYPCYYGTDIESSEPLIAYRHTVDEICEQIGADSVGYLAIADLPKLDATGHGSFCDACFTGNYPTPAPPPGGFAFETWLGS